jgi:hypothetical protein
MDSWLLQNKGLSLLSFCLSFRSVYSSCKNMGRHCSWGECNSDSRKEETTVTFVPFPKPTILPDKAKRWTILCGRGDGFKVSDITRFSTICSKHFASGTNLDIKENPSLEPFNALWSTQKLRKALNPRRTLARDDVDKAEEGLEGRQKLQSKLVTYASSRHRSSLAVSFLAAPVVPLSAEFTDSGTISNVRISVLSLHNSHLCRISL